MTRRMGIARILALCSMYVHSCTRISGSTWTAVHVQYGSVGHGDRTNSLTVVQYSMKYFRTSASTRTGTYESTFESTVLSYFGSTCKLF